MLDIFSQHDYNSSSHICLIEVTIFYAIEIYLGRVGAIMLIKQCYTI